MLWQQMQQQTVDLGWEFYGPVMMMVALIALAVPVWAALGIGSVVMLVATDVLPISLLGESLFDGIDHFALIAVPLFILTGDVLVRTGLSNKLLDVADATTGGVRAGLGTSTVLGCGFFACISGSDAAGAAAVGRMTIHKLVEKGYPRPYACALVASGACTGILIPPSIAYIILGLILGGKTGFDFGHWRRTVWDGRFALLVPFIILGGIYSGIFTPTEAAAVAVATTITIGLLQKTLTLADFPKMLLGSAKVNGVILPIIAMSLPLAQTLAALGVPQGFAYSVTSMTDNPYIIILLIIGILIAAGCVMETTPNIVILAPILLPLAQEAGMNDIQFSIMMVTALGVGFITPPLGLNLFVISGITGESVLKIASQVGPYVIGMLIVVLMIAYIPALSTVFLPDIY